MKKTLRSPRRARGFTLMEILIVIALIGLVLGVSVLGLGDIFAGGQADTEKLRVQKNGSFDATLTVYKIKVGSYPSTQEGLQALLTAPEGKADRWTGPYLKDHKDLTDSFGSAYRYQFPGTRNPRGYDLWSTGPDKQDGTPDDIGNW